MLEIVALSVTDRLSSPSPKTSTNFPTTPVSRSNLVIESTKSVAVHWFGIFPVSFNPTTCGHEKNIG